MNRLISSPRKGPAAGGVAPDATRPGPLRVATLTRYARKGASSRLRCLLYMPDLERQGLVPKALPLFDDAYLNRLYSGQSTMGPTLSALARRLADLRRAGSADLLWIEKELLPWLPWFVEAALLPRGIPYAVDFDDAVFHRYDLHRSRLVRRLLGRKLDHLMAGAALVTAGNGYLADRARRAGAPRVEVVPTVVDTEVYLPVARSGPDSPAVVGWIGSPSTWAEFMLPMLPRLLDAVATADGSLLVVGADAGGGTHPRLVRSNWTEDTEVDLIRRMDIGIMPLTDTPWSRGKCGYKLIQYMACGLPVVASPVGVNREIVEHGVNGFLAEGPREWAEALRLLMDDPVLRRKMGDAGRSRVERDYSLQVWGPRLAEMLQDAARGRQRA